MSSEIPDNAILPNVSETERNFDPISKRRIAGARNYIAESAEVIDRNAPNLSPEARTQFIARRARALENAARQDEPPLDLSQLQQRGMPPLAGRVAQRISSLSETAKGADSLLDFTPVSGLREAETVGDLLPIAGATIGAGLPVGARLREMRDPARRAMRGLMPAAQRMLKERGVELSSGALGAAIGGMMDMRLEDAARYIKSGGDPAIFKKSPVLGAFVAGQGSADSFTVQSTRLLNRAIQEASLESAGFFVGQVPGKAFRELAKITSGDEAFLRKMVDDAMKVGVPVGIVDVSNSKVASMGRKILSPFGLMSGAFSDPLQQRARDIQRAGRRVSSGLSTDLTEILKLEQSDPAAASRMVARFNSGGFRPYAKAFEKYVNDRNALWNTFTSAADSAGVIVIPANTRAAAGVSLGKYFGGGTARALKKGAREQIEGLTKAEQKLLEDDIFEEIPVRDDMQHLKDVFDHIKNLEDEPSVSQMDALGKRINVALGSVRSNAAKAELYEVLSAIRSDIDTGLQGANPEILAMREEAKRFTEQWITLLSGKAGQKIGRVSGDFGQQKVQFVRRPGDDAVAGAEDDMVKNAGMTDPTEFLERFWKDVSFGEVEDLAKLSKLSGQEGKKAFTDGVALRYQQAFNNATNDDGVVDPKRIMKNLGLDDPTSKKGAAMTHALELAGGNIDNVRRIMRLSSHIFRDGFVSPSQFAARRAILGGLSSGLGASGAFLLSDDEVSLTKTAMIGLATVAMGRGFGRLITNPKHTRSLLQVLDPSFSNSTKIRALRRLAANGYLGTMEEIRDEESAFNRGVDGFPEGVEKIRGMASEYMRAGARRFEDLNVRTPLPQSGRAQQGGAVGAAQAQQPQGVR